MSIGAHSYIGDAFKYLGASHAFENDRVPYIVNPDPRRVLEYDPDVVVYEQKLGEKATIESVKKRMEREGLGTLRAVRNGSIIVMEYNSLAHYGPSFFNSIEELVTKVRQSLEAGPQRP